MKINNFQLYIYLYYKIGLRLYFSGSSPVQSYMPFRNRVNAPPDYFRLIHVRTPPIINQETSNGYYQRISNPQMSIHIADYSGGVFLASNAVSEEMDVLIGMAPYMPFVIHVSLQKKKKYNI